jgi:hypothetical protein
MELVIFGSRGISDYTLVKDLVDKFVQEMNPAEDLEIVSGMARGVDTLAVRYAEERNIRLNRFPADWKKFGRKAGPLRNIEMSEYADYGLAIWDGVSRGTAHMISLMENRCRVHDLKQP